MLVRIAKTEYGEKWHLTLYMGRSICGKNLTALSSHDLPIEDALNMQGIFCDSCKAYLEKMQNGLLTETLSMV